MKELNKKGILEFEFAGNPEILEVHIFQANEFLGDPIETEEMRPQWFSIENIPYTDMWPDDIYWLPMFLEGKTFNGRFVFGEGDIILEHELNETQTL